MKTAKLATVFILVLLLSIVAGVPVINEVKANPSGMFRMVWRDIIVIQSPQNKTYNGETLLLNFTVEHLPETSSYLTRYVLQNMDARGHLRRIVNVTLKRTNATHEYKYATAPIAQYDSNLSNLADGTYKLTVQRYYENSREPEGITVRSSASVIFTVDTTQINAAEIPEFPPWIILPIFIIATIFALIVKKKLFPFSLASKNCD